MSGIEGVSGVCWHSMEQPDVLLARREEELVWAGARGPIEQRLFEALTEVPRPGALELELEGLISNTGGRLSVTAIREPTGAFAVRLSGGAQVGLSLGAGGFLGGSVAASWRVETPEAAADLIQAATLAVAMPALSARLGLSNYQSRLLRFELEGAFAAGFKTSLPVVMGDLELAGVARVVVDLEHEVMKIEQGVKLDGTARGGVLIAAAGIEGTASARLVTEISWPRGQSLAELSKDLQVPQSLVFEGEGRAEVHTGFGAGAAELTSIEAQVDLVLLAEHLSEPSRAMSGVRRTFFPARAPSGSGLELPQVSLKARATTWHLMEVPLFDSLSCELDEARFESTLRGR
jgi:hypothetical protein